MHRVLGQHVCQELSAGLAEPHRVPHHHKGEVPRLPAPHSVVQKLQERCTVPQDTILLLSDGLSEEEEEG